MKTATEFGPWAMSAHDCRMNSFWRRRLVALQSGKERRKRTSRRHGVGLLLMLVLMIVMPSWQLGEQTATAQERDNTVTVDAPALPDNTEIPPTPAGVAQRRVVPMPQVLVDVPPTVPKSSRPWQLVDSPQLPSSNKIVLVEGQHVYFDMPKGGEISTEAVDGIFTAKMIETTGDILIRGLKSGVGTLKFSKREHKNVEFQIVVVSDPAPLRTKLDESGLDHIVITPGVQSVTLSGNLMTPNELKRCIALADELYPHVVNNIRIRNQQVQLHCRIFEFTIDEAGLDSVLAKLFRGGDQKSHSQGIYSSLLDSNAFSTRFDELRKTVETKMIAEPTLVTVSGRPAAFNAGGEFPILIPQGGNTVAVEYKRFGTRVDFVPSVLEDKRIHLDVRPQLTQLMHDDEYGVKVDGKAIPALKSRWVDVAAEMTPEQTMVALLVHENKKGQKVGFVTMVRPSLLSAGRLPEVPLGVPSAPPTQLQKADATHKEKLR